MPSLAERESDDLATTNGAVTTVGPTAAQQRQAAWEREREAQQQRRREHLGALAQRREREFRESQQRARAQRERDEEERRTTALARSERRARLVEQGMRNTARNAHTQQMLLREFACSVHGGSDRDAGEVFDDEFALAANTNATPLFPDAGRGGPWTSGGIVAWDNSADRERSRWALPGPALTAATPSPSSPGGPVMSTGHDGGSGANTRPATGSLNSRPGSRAGPGPIVVAPRPCAIGMLTPAPVLTAAAIRLPSPSLATPDPVDAALARTRRVLVSAALRGATGSPGGNRASLVGERPGTGSLPPTASSRTRRGSTAYGTKLDNRKRDIGSPPHVVDGRPTSRDGVPDQTGSGVSWTLSYTFAGGADYAAKNAAASVPTSAQCVEIQVTTAVVQQPVETAPPQLVLTPPHALDEASVGSKRGTHTLPARAGFVAERAPAGGAAEVSSSGSPSPLTPASTTSAAASSSAEKKSPAAAAAAAATRLEAARALARQMRASKHTVFPAPNGGINAAPAPLGQFDLSYSVPTMGVVGYGGAMLSSSGAGMIGGFMRPRAGSNAGANPLSGEASLTIPQLGFGDEGLSEADWDDGSRSQRSGGPTGAPAFHALDSAVSHVYEPSVHVMHIRAAGAVATSAAALGSAAAASGAEAAFYRRAASTLPGAGGVAAPPSLGTQWSRTLARRMRLHTERAETDRHRDITDARELQALRKGMHSAPNATTASRSDASGVASTIRSSTGATESLLRLDALDESHHRADGVVRRLPWVPSTNSPARAAAQLRTLPTVSACARGGAAPDDRGVDIPAAWFTERGPRTTAPHSTLDRTLPPGVRAIAAARSLRAAGEMQQRAASSLAAPLPALGAAPSANAGRPTPSFLHDGNKAHASRALRLLSGMSGSLVGVDGL